MTTVIIGGQPVEFPPYPSNPKKASGGGNAIPIADLPASGALSLANLLAIGQNGDKRTTLQALMTLFAGSSTPVPKYGGMVVGNSIMAAQFDAHTSMLEKVCMLSGQKWIFRRNFAIGGKTVQQIRTEQLLSQALTQDPLPKFIVCEGGYNDLAFPAAAIATLEQMYLDCIKKGVVPVAVLTHPRSENQDVGTANASYELNNGIAALVLKYGLPVWDLAGFLWSPEAYFFQDPTETNDGTHQMVRTNSRVAKKILADGRFTGLVPADGGIQTNYSNNDPRNWAVNGKFVLPGPDNGAGYWENDTGTKANVEFLRPDALKSSGRRLQIMNKGGVYNGSTLGVEVNPGGRIEISGTIASKWGKVAADRIANIPWNQDRYSPTYLADNYVAANAKDAAIPFDYLLNVYFTSNDYTQDYGTKFALGKPGSDYEESTIRVELDVPAGAQRAILIFGKMNANASDAISGDLNNQTWCSIETLNVTRMW